MFVETSLKKQQQKNQEHITPMELRRFVADRCPLEEIKTIFDGSVGSGQLLQFIDFEHLTGIDVNKDSLDCCKTNFPNSILINNSFFAEMDRFSENQFDFCISNYPFSLKINELSEMEKSNILNDEVLNKFFKNNKLTGVCDFLFIIKMMQMSKRYSMFIAFPGIGYRRQEFKYREYLTPFVKEIGLLENCNFETTSISVLYILIDKQNTGGTLSFRKDFKSGEYAEKKIKLDADNWEITQFPREEIKITRDEVIKLESVARKEILKRIEQQVKFSQCIEEIEGTDFPPVQDFKKSIIELLESIIPDN